MPIVSPKRVRFSILASSGVSSSMRARKRFVTFTRPCKSTHRFLGADVPVVDLQQVKLPEAARRLVDVLDGLLERKCAVLLDQRAQIGAHHDSVTR